MPTQGALQYSHPDTTTLNLIDLELLSAWKDSTAPSIARFMSRMEVVNVFWRTTVPEIGFSYPFVLHACLALSGMHLSRFKRDRSHFYRAEAERHWAQGFSMATSQIRRVSDESYHALFIFSMLSCMYKLAKGPRAGDYLAFGGEQAGDASEWHIYYNGLLSFLTIGLDALRSGPLAQLFDIFTRRTRRFFAPEAPVDPDPIADLRALCTSVLGAEHPRRDTYRAAIDNLARCYAVVFEGETEGEFDLFIWTLNISEEFIVCIQQREPVALAVFAYFVVLLNELSGWWVLDGWIHHLISGIYDALSEGARLWLRWPMEQTGWLPP